MASTFGKILGGALDKVGTALRLPELGISEKLAGGRTANTGLTQQSQAAGMYYNANNPANYQIYGPVPSGQSQYKSAPTTGGAAPSTGGQTLGASTGSSGGSGGGSYGAGINLTPPAFADQSQSNNANMDLLRQQYDASRNDINAQNGQLDQSYNLSKGDIENAISQTEQAAQQQKQDQSKLFGDLLRNQLQTYQDTNRQRMGTFSALGSLDSSEFQNQQFKGDQAYAQQRGQTETEQTKTLKQIDDSVVNYRKQATSELSKLALQYQSGKQAIQSALSQNNLQEAGAIQNALDQIRQRAADVQNSMISFANQAALLKAQGNDVRVGIQGTTGNDYAQYINNLLAQQTATGKSMYALPTSGVQGSGYIGQGTSEDQKKKNPFLNGLGV